MPHDAGAIVHDIESLDVCFGMLRDLGDPLKVMGKRLAAVYDSTGMEQKVNSVNARLYVATT
jgi:hypothetical protein